jgi:hypothetical protein
MTEGFNAHDAYAYDGIKKGDGKMHTRNSNRRTNTMVISDLSHAVQCAYSVAYFAQVSLDEGER